MASPIPSCSFLCARVQSRAAMSRGRPARPQIRPRAHVAEYERFGGTTLCTDVESLLQEVLSPCNLSFLTHVLVFPFVGFWQGDSENSYAQRGTN